jgi:hypothetical protein
MNNNNNNQLSVSVITSNVMKTPISNKTNSIYEKYNNEKNNTTELNNDNTYKSNKGICSEDGVNNDNNNNNNSFSTILIKTPSLYDSNNKNIGKDKNNNNELSSILNDDILVQFYEDIQYIFPILYNIEKWLNDIEQIKLPNIYNRMSDNKKVLKFEEKIKELFILFESINFFEMKLKYEKVNGYLEDLITF